MNRTYKQKNADSFWSTVLFAAGLASSACVAWFSAPAVPTYNAAMASVASVNRENLRVARANRGLSTLEATEKISSGSKDLVAQWENGESVPTWSQLEKLADAYNISPILLAGKEKLTEYKVVPDFRVGVDHEKDDRVKRLLNVVISRQEWLEEELKSQDFPKNPLVGLGRNISSPERLANLIIEKLEINITHFRDLRGRDCKKRALDYLISQAEARNIFVSRTFSSSRNIEVKNLRGIFISNDYSPFIVLNHKDAAAGQIFSFIHELSHLFRKTDAISNSTEFREGTKNVDKEEIFCNRVSVEFLLPAKEFKQTSYTKEEISRLSDIYKASEIAVFYRLKELKKIIPHLADEMESQIEEEMRQNIAQNEARQKANEGGNFYNSLKMANGKLFNNVVLRNYRDKKIGFVEASKLLRGSAEKI